MRAELDPLRPVIGDSAMKLGVRDGQDGRKADLAPDDEGNAVPGQGGMSVVDSLAGFAARIAKNIFPPDMLPQRLNDTGQIPGAMGKNHLHVFRMGEGAFANAPLTDRLQLAPDHDHHGTVEPRMAMPYDEYRQAIYNTRDQWESGEADE